MDKNTSSEQGAMVRSHACSATDNFNPTYKKWPSTAAPTTGSLHAKIKGGTEKESKDRQTCAEAKMNGGTRAHERREVELLQQTRRRQWPAPSLAHDHPPGHRRP